MAGEVVGQYFFNFGIRTVTGDFSSSGRLYKISGVYATGTDFNYEPPFDPSKRTVRESFDWVAEGRYSQATKAINEKLDFFNRTTRQSAGSFTSTMQCDQDPWLEAPGPCQFIVTTPTGSPPGTFVGDMAMVVPSAPFSSALTTGERAELNLQFHIFLSVRQKVGPESLTTVESTAPIIVAPHHNGYMVYKKSEFVIEPAPNFPGDEILVEFRRLDTPGAPRKPWRVPATTLSSGVLIPFQIFGAQPGPYAMRARIDAPQPGDFSREIRFEYLMESPFLTTPSKGPVEISVTRTR
jgi:hypothetical protein